MSWPTIRVNWFTSLLIAAVTVWGTTLFTSFGWLLRYDPLSVDNAGIVSDAACIYLSATGVRTVYVVAQPKGASCETGYQFGSNDPCPAEGYPNPGICEVP